MNLALHYPILQVIIPMLVAPIALLMPNRKLAWALATTTSLCAFALAIAIAQLVLEGSSHAYPLGDWPAPFGIELRVDSFSAIVLIIVSGASTAALLAGFQSLALEIDQDRATLFYAAWLLALAGLSGIVVSADAFNIFVFMEIASLASYILVAGSSDRRALPAVFKYLIMGTIGATFYLIGVGLLYIMTGTLNLADLEVRILLVEDQAPILMAAGFISVGLALKAAIFPLHAWLPKWHCMSFYELIFLCSSAL
jgi:multicomponent Na+:H+ antiporter subunit D